MKSNLLITICLLIACLAAAYAPSACLAADCYASVIVKDVPADSFKLLGTILEANSDSSIAVIRDLDSQIQGMYKIGSKIGDFQIVRIQRGEIILLKGGKTFILSFPLGSETEPIVAVSDSKIIINRQAVTKKIPDMNTALQQAIALPYIKAGKVKGLKITNIKDKTLAMKAGIKEGDIITSVNSQKIDSAKAAMQILQSIPGQEKISIELKRGSDTKNLVYYIN